MICVKGLAGMAQRAKGMSLYAKDKLNHVYFDSGQGFVTGERRTNALCD